MLTGIGVWIAVNVCVSCENLSQLWIARVEKNGTCYVLVRLL